MKKILYLSLLFALVGSTLLAAKLPAKHVSKTAKNRADETTRIKLTLGNKIYELQAYNLSYYASRATDKTKPAEGAIALYSSNSFSITIRSSKVDQDFIDWMLLPEPQIKDAQIVIYDADSNRIMRTVTFTGVRPNSYNESNGSIGYGNSTNPYTSFSLNYKTVSVKI